MAKNEPISTNMQHTYNFTHHKKKDHGVPTISAQKRTNREHIKVEQCETFIMNSQSKNDNYSSSGIEDADI